MNQPVPIQDNSQEKAVWSRFLTGDTAAFEWLISSNFRALFHYGTKFSHDKEFVKDSIQDLFLLLWEKRENLSRDIPIKPYMMASLRRLMHRSSNKNRVSEDFNEQNKAGFVLEFSVEEEYIQLESTKLVTQKLRELMDKLPKRQKEVLYLKFFQELERDQISEIMEISPQTVSNLLQIAIKHLKNHWKTEFLTFLLVQFAF
jgi:RNA polymerase sigma factor (sigma-70 family)